MSDFEDDFSDFDDEFIALTLKPIRLEPSGNETQPDVASSHDGELQAAKGEIAVLRSKIMDIERLNKQEREQQVVSNQNATMALEAKISSLETTVRRLEDERKFLSVEVKNLSSRKKRKTGSPSNDTDTQLEARATPTVTATATTSTTTTPTPIRFVPQLADDNAMFIDNISRHSITGLRDTTIEYLDKIVLTQNFFFDGLVILADEPISIHLIKYLNSNKNILRLDQLIDSFAQLLIQLIKSLLELNGERFYLPIPFLLSLLQNCVIFRPSAITKELTITIISFNLDIMMKFDSILKPKEIIGELHERHEKIKIKVVQLELLKKLPFLFSLEIIEILLINLSQFNDVEFNKNLLLKFENQFTSLIKLIFSTNSCINLIYIMINIINCLLNSYEDEDLSKFPLLNQNILDNLLKILNNGIPIKRGWFITGMNKIIGNDQDNQLIEKLINWNVKVNKYPQVIYPVEEYNEFDILNNNEFQLTNLNFQILIILEKLILFFNNSKSDELHIKDSFFLKSIVSSIAKQQQLNIIRPKSNLSHLRSKYISKLIRILNLYWESTMLLNSADDHQQNEVQPQQTEMQDDIMMTPMLPKEITQMLMITLSRIAFSNNETSQESIEFLFKIRSIKGLKKIPIFNKFTESKAREISHTNNNDQELSLKELINCEIGLSNGVEFAYDDDVVELARDMLEKFTTMNEADSLFSAMNADG